MPAHWYAIGLIWPLAILLRPPYDLISHVIKLIVIVIPTTALIIPGYHGLALLSGYSGKDLSSLKRNTLGALIIVAGGLIGLGIQFGWATLARP